MRYARDWYFTFIMLSDIDLRYSLADLIYAYDTAFDGRD